MVNPRLYAFAGFFFVKRRNGGMDDDVMKSNNENESFRSFLISFLFAGLFFNFVNISFFFVLSWYTVALMFPGIVRLSRFY